MANQPTCQCLLQPPMNWWPQPPVTDPFKYYRPGGSNLDSIKLTAPEKAVLEHLYQAWDEFTKLDSKHPDENAEFRAALHDLQRIVAIRVARRVDPDVWRGYPPDEDNQNT